MELLKSKMISILLVTLCLQIGCAKNFSSVLNSPEKLVTEEKLSQNFLGGQVILEDGSTLDLSTLNDKPILLFFVGEFCGTCRTETEHLKEMISAKGIPTKIHMVSVMLEVETGTITDWFDGISPTAQKWLLGSDPNLSLYFSYFQQIVTPSILFFDPQTQVLKRKQSVIPLTQLEQETGPWY